MKQLEHSIHRRIVAVIACVQGDRLPHEGMIAREAEVTRPTIIEAVIDSNHADIFVLNLMFETTPFANIRIRRCPRGRRERIDQGFDYRRLFQCTIAKCLRRNKADQRLVAALTQALVREKEKGAVFQDGPPTVPPNW